MIAYKCCSNVWSLSEVYAERTVQRMLSRVNRTPQYSLAELSQITSRLQSHSYRVLASRHVVWCDCASKISRLYFGSSMLGRMHRYHGLARPHCQRAIISSVMWRHCIGIAAIARRRCSRSQSHHADHRAGCFSRRRSSDQRSQPSIAHTRRLRARRSNKKLHVGSNKARGQKPWILAILCERITTTWNNNQSERWVGV